MKKIKCALNILQDNEYINKSNIYYIANNDTSLKATKISSTIGDGNGLKFMKKLADKITNTNQYIVFNNCSSYFYIIDKNEIDEFLANIETEEIRIDELHWQIRNYIKEKEDFEIKSGIIHQDIIYNLKIIKANEQKEIEIEKDAIDLLEKIW